MNTIKLSARRFLVLVVFQLVCASVYADAETYLSARISRVYASSIYVDTNTMPQIPVSYEDEEGFGVGILYGAYQGKARFETEFSYLENKTEFSGTTLTPAGFEEYQNYNVSAAAYYTSKRLTTEDIVSEFYIGGGLRYAYTKLNVSPTLSNSFRNLGSDNEFQYFIETGYDFIFNNGMTMITGVRHILSDQTYLQNSTALWVGVRFDLK